MSNSLVEPELTGVTLASRVLSWWKGNGRSFPWRKTRNPYEILISEVLLHRTRAEQVVPIYSSFVGKYPNVLSLSTVPSTSIEKLIHSLGLRWRARLIHGMIETIVSEYVGRVPDRLEDLRSLPGVSDYIASAVCVFAYGLDETLLDTNTVRIIGRVFGIPVSDSSRRSNAFRKLYQTLRGNANSKEFAYAMIDLGSAICTAKNPECHRCPVQLLCRFGRGRTPQN